MVKGSGAIAFALSTLNLARRRQRTPLRLRRGQPSSSQVEPKSIYCPFAGAHSSRSMWPSDRSPVCNWPMFRDTRVARGRVCCHPVGVRPAREPCARCGPTRRQTVAHQTNHEPGHPVELAQVHFVNKSKDLHEETNDIIGHSYCCVVARGFSCDYAANVVVDIDVAPPASRYENAPARVGYISAPGYYQWDEGRHQHVWMKGEYQYQTERRGEHYVPNQWSEQNGRYHFNEGRWEKGEKGQ